MIRKLALTALCIALLFPAPAQEKATGDRPFADRIWFGGGIGLSFGTVTAVQIDPLVGYKVDRAGKFSTGIGGSYWSSATIGSRRRSTSAHTGIACSPGTGSLSRPSPMPSSCT